MEFPLATHLEVVILKQSYEVILMVSLRIPLTSKQRIHMGVTNYITFGMKLLHRRSFELHKCKPA